MRSSPEELRSGWIPRFSIRELIEQHPDVFRSADAVLISMLDSNENIHELPAVAGTFVTSDSTELLSSEPFVVNGAGLLRLLGRRDLFTGFDEIWLLRHVVDAPPPVDASLVAPEQVGSEPPESVAKWMEDSGAVLGLGDGIGMNFVGADDGLLTQLGLV
jgi:hypothetical protein